MVQRVLALCGLLLSAAASPAGDPINPFTGAPLSLEHARWALEQARLDEQLQSSLLNRRKFEVERQRLDLPDSPALPGTMATRSAEVSWPAGKPAGISPSTGVLTAPAGALSAETARARPTGLGSGAPAGVGLSDASVPGLQPLRRSDSETGSRPPAKRRVVKAREIPHIVGVRGQSAGWCLLIEDPPDLAEVCPGAQLAGRHLDSVSAEQYVLDGVGHALLVPVARLPAASPPFGTPPAQLAASAFSPGTTGAAVPASVVEAGEDDTRTALVRERAAPLQVPAEWMR